MKEKKYQFQEHHYEAIGKMIQMYAKKRKPHKGKGRPPEIKMKWLNGMLKKQFYTEHERKYLMMMRNDLMGRPYSHGYDHKNRRFYLKEDFPIIMMTNPKIGFKLKDYNLVLPNHQWS
jgi:hypothetical protein